MIIIICFCLLKIIYYISICIYQTFQGKNEVVEEKFKKLKDVYSKLREEHIDLIRKVCI